MISHLKFLEFVYCLNMQTFLRWAEGLLSKIKQYEIPIAAKKLDIQLPVKKDLSLSVKGSVKKLDVPSPPKKPLSAYMIFLNDNREKLMKDKPKLHITGVVKLLADQWNQLDKSAKEPFQKRARDFTVAYAEEHKKYLENLTGEQKAAIHRHKTEASDYRHLKKLKKALKDNDYPKSPTSAYALFVQSEAGTIDGKDSTGFLKKVAEKWKTMPETSKERFRRQAEKDRAEYPVKLEKWRCRMESEGQHDLLNQCNDLLRPIGAKVAAIEKEPPKTKRKETTQPGV